MFQESPAFRDLVSRIDSLEPLEGLSLLVHSPDNEDRLLGFMICSYGDESGDKRVYSYSALIGPLKEFVELERQWRRTLTVCRLPEFHAEPMENRNKPYEHLEREQRAHYQSLFIGLIAKQNVWGWCMYIKHSAFQKHQHELRTRVFGGDNPHALTFRMLVEVMALELDEGGFPPQPIAFVFDRNKQYEGFTLEMYNSLANGNWPKADRLGSLSFDSRLEKIALQASDAWAYEARKYVSDTILNTHEERWQMSMFREAGRFNIRGYDEQTLPTMLARAEREREEKTQALGNLGVS